MLTQRLYPNNSSTSTRKGNACNVLMFRNLSVKRIVLCIRCWPVKESSYAELMNLANIMQEYIISYSFNFKLNGIHRK